MNLTRFDPDASRVCSPLPFSFKTQATLVPGFRFEAHWKGPGANQPEAKVWHWPLQSLPVILRAFPGVTTQDPQIANAIVRAKQINAARAITMEYARSLVNRLDAVIPKVLPNGKSLLAHQFAAARAALAAGGSRGIFHQTGTGKTITAGTMLWLLTRPVDGFRISVVVCPVTLIGAAWQPDLASWFPDLPVVSLRDHAKGRARSLAVENCIAHHGRCVALINYESMRTDGHVRRIMSGAYVVYDEISKCKSYKSAISVVARETAATYRGCLLLSGTPAPNGNDEYWPHSKILSAPAGYDAFPGGHSAFEKEFCEVKTFQRRNEPGVKHFAGHEFKTGMSARVHERLARVCEWIKKEECFDLSPKVYQRIPIELSAKTADAYAEMSDKLTVSLLGKYQTREDLRVHAVNALSQRMKLRQITAGFVPAFPEQWVGGSADDAKVLVPLGREKIDWLLDHCETVNERIVIWTQFIFEAQRYVDELTKRQTKKDPWLFTCAAITGQTREADRPETFRRFVAGDYQVLIAHPGVAQWGVSLPGVSLAAYGSLSYSLQEYAQSQDRIHGIGRGDATKHSTYYLLTAKARGADTIDADCLDVLDGKCDLLDLVFRIDRARRENGFVPQNIGARIDA